MRRAKTSSICCINTRIKEYLRKNRIRSKEFAPRINLKPNSLNIFLNGYRCDVDRLWQVSNALNYNFFSELADEIQIEQPKREEPREMTELRQKVQKLETELKTERQQVHDLKLELKVLKEFVQLSAAK